MENGVYYSGVEAQSVFHATGSGAVSSKVRSFLGKDYEIHPQNAAV
jgi:hypothetical protein